MLRWSVVCKASGCFETGLEADILITFKAKINQLCIISARVKGLSVMRTNHKGFRLSWKCDAINNQQGPEATGGSPSTPPETLKRANQSSAGSSLKPLFTGGDQQLQQPPPPPLNSNNKFPSNKIVFEIKLMSKGQPRMLYTTTATSFVVPSTHRFSIYGNKEQAGFYKKRHLCRKTQSYIVAQPWNNTVAYTQPLSCIKSVQNFWA